MRSGLTGFVAALAYNPEFAARGVTLNSLLPGKFDTDRLAGTLASAAQKTGQYVDKIRQAQQNQVPASAQTEWPNCPQVSAPPIPKCNTAKELRGPEPPSLHTNQRTRTPCPGAGAQAPVPSAGKSSATAAAAATPTTLLTCAALGVASSVAPQEAVPTVRSICLRAPALALCCSLRQALLTPANGRSPLEAAPPRQAQARVTRKHLLLPLCTARRRSQKGLAGLPAQRPTPHGPCHALAPLQETRQARANQEPAEHPCAPAQSP